MGLRYEEVLYLNTIMILALDLSSKSSGFCVGNGESIIDYGCITSSSQILLKRISIMRDALKEILNKYDITTVVIEEVRTDYKNIKTYKALTWLQGIINMLIYEHNPKIEVVYLQPSEWRSTIGIHTGRGIKREELKQADINYVKKKYNIEANDDICDSICLYDAYYHKNSFMF